MMKISISAGVVVATMLLGLVPAAGAQVRVGENYRLNHDSAPYRGQDQVAFAVKPSDPQHVVAVNANYLDSTCEASRSLDGGATWSPAFPLNQPAPAAGQEPFIRNCSSGAGTSQYVEFGSGNDVYTVQTAQRRLAAGNATSLLLYKSTDGGLSWQGSVAVEGAPLSWSRPSLAVHRGAGTGGADRIYLIGRVGTGFRSIVSNNGGQSFSTPPVAVNPATPATSDFATKPVILPTDGPDDSVHVVWRTSGPEGQLQASKSTDGGATWSSTPVNITKVRNTGNNGTTHLPLPLDTTTGASSGSSYPELAGNPANGDLYLTYIQGAGGPTAPEGGYQGTDHFISYDSQVYFQRSRDGGATWSTPENVSDAAPLPGSMIPQTRHPSISVSPGGRINIVWQDRRHWFMNGTPFPTNVAASNASFERNCTHSHIFCEDIRLGDTYYAYSNDRGTTFPAAIRINDRSHNNDVGYDTRPSGYWWFGPQSITVGSDQRELIGWMDSRNGNWDNDNEDIYLAKVDHNAAGDVPRTYLDDTANDVEKSVALAKVAYQGGNEGGLVGYTRDPANAGFEPCVSPAITGCAVFGPASRNASAVVIADETDLPGAMAGTVLARANPAPLLLSPAAGLTASVIDEVKRMRPAAAYVIGDSLAPKVITDLESAAGLLPGLTERLPGGDPASTAASIAAELDRRTTVEKDANLPAFDAVVIANPSKPDAAAAVGLAAARRLPYLYTNADGSIPASTTQALQSLDIEKTLVIGGTSSVPSLVGLPGPQRLAGTDSGGADHYATSRAVVDEARKRGMPGNIVYVADGAKPMDATLLSGVVARATGMLLLAPAPVHSSTAAQATTTPANLTRVDRFVILGPATSTPPPPPPPPPAAPPAAPGPVGDPPAAVSPAKPVLSKVSLSSRRFRASRGTSIRLTLSKDAKVRIVVARRSVGRRIGRNCVSLTPITRRRTPCVRYVTRGSLTSSRKAGASTVRFTGRAAGRRLPPGAYRFTLQATDSANRKSNKVNVTFTVVR